MPFRIAKTNDEQQVVFGWASVAKDKDGWLLEDWEGDVIEPEDLEKAAFDFVLHFRDTGERHDPNCRKMGKLVSSIVFTDEVQKALGISPGILPVGWFVGFHIENTTTWQEVKNGKYQMFSIEGEGVRSPIKKTQKAMTFSQVQKYNKNHDKLGRFTSGTSSGGTRKGNVTVPMSLIVTEKGDPYGAYGKNVKDEPGFYSVVMHGSKDCFGTIDSVTKKIVKKYTPDELCDIIKGQKDYKGGAIKLFSCSVGAKDATAAQGIANRMGVIVKAPVDLVWLSNKGYSHVGPKIDVAIPEKEAWREFKPRNL